MDIPNKEIINGWSKSEKMVESYLTDLRIDMKEVKKDLNEMKIELALIKQKAGLWGAISGIVTSVTVLVGSFIKSKVGGA
jgi:hypothetical protein